MNIQKQMQQITSPDISRVISQGLAQIYLTKPNFPITYLANWLNQYSSSQKKKVVLVGQQKHKNQKYLQIQKHKQNLLAKELQQNQEKTRLNEVRDHDYQNKINQTKHLQDLLHEWLPEFIQKNFNFTGAYVGKLDFNKKSIEEGNFQPGAQNDTQNPKIITYVGASHSHQNLMLKNTLPNGKGVTYDIFQQVPQQTNQQGQIVENTGKKTYHYINNVLSETRLHYFKYPKLGAYVCYPIKIKSCLNIPTFDKGVVEYKAYLKTKQQTEKEYQQKLNQAKGEADEANKKYEDFELNQEDPSSHQQKRTLQAQAKLADQKLQELIKNPPAIEQVKFQTVQKNYFIGCDTLGQDRQIPQVNLESIDKKIKHFTRVWQQKQTKMVLTDILAFLQDQLQLQNIQNILQEHQKNVISNNQSQIKEQFINKEKQAEFQLSLIKCDKTRQLLNENPFKNSMQVYLNYNIPKFTQLIQIWCMLLGQSKADINLQNSNQLNHRKIINRDNFKILLSKLEKYELKRKQSNTVAPDYKINKLLQRLQKIDIQSLSKYNSFLFLLHSLLKTYCWTRILCRDAKKQIFQTKTKLKQDRDNQIQKWLGQIQKNLQTAKSQLDEQGQQNFKEEDWRKTYESENPKPQPLDAPVYREFLDIQ